MRPDVDPPRYGDSIFQIQEVSRSGWRRFAVIGELDISTALTFRRRLRAFRAANTSVYLDLSQVEFMDSVGARAVLDAVAASRDGAWRVEVEPPGSRQARRCFELMRETGRYEPL